VTLQYILSHAEASTVIPGLETPTEVAQNVRASGAPRLSRAERERLRPAAPQAEGHLPMEYRWLRQGMG